MLMISREALVKIGKHSWNVYPLEAFGFVLGTPDGQNILAVLPCSKTSRWSDFSDRWCNIQSNLCLARGIAHDFGLEVTGLYFSTQDELSTYPRPDVLGDIPVGFLIAYQAICCPAHSCPTIFRQSNKFTHSGDYLFSKGKRASLATNQRRIHQAWLKVIGSLDYSNGKEHQGKVT